MLYTEGIHVLGLECVLKFRFRGGKVTRTDLVPLIIKCKMCYTRHLN